MRLSDIPKAKLERIKRYVQEQKGKIPVVSEGESLVKKVKEEFGVELSPQQIYLLQRGYITKRVRIPEDLALELEKKYGSITAGIKKTLALAQQMEMPKIPATLRPVWEALKGKTLSYHDAVIKIADTGYPDPDGAIRELFRLGYGENIRGKLRFLEHRKPPELSLLAFFASSGR